MGIKKFASHYMLDGTGHFIKWPLVSVSDAGEINEVDFYPHGFQESPGVQFFSGLMLPAFIDGLTLNHEFPSQTISGLLNRHFGKGTLWLVLPSIPGGMGTAVYQPPILVERPKQIGSKADGPLIKNQDSGEPVFDRLKKSRTIQTERSLSECLMDYTATAADELGLKTAGRIEPGNQPGLILIQNLDLKNLKLQPGSVVRWLNVPIFD